MRINLPGWSYNKLKEISTKITDGSHNPPKGQAIGKLMLSAKNITNNSIEFGNGRFISEEDYIVEDKRTSIKTGDVLLTIVATIGRSAVVPNNAPDFTLQRSVAVIKPTINSKYLSYYFQSPTFQRLLFDNAKGTAQKGVYLKTLNSLEVAYPSPPEQQEIVAKIEEFFSELDKGKEQLETARQQLKVYRQAVLKWAFEGKFTNSEVEEGELPKGWKWVKFSQLFSDKPQNGIYKSSSAYGSGTPIIRIDGFYDGTILNDYEFKRVNLTKEEIQKYKIALGNILVNRVNSMSHLGKCGLVKQLKEETVFESNIMKVQVKTEQALPEYISIYLSSKSGLNELTKNAKHAVNQASINQTDVGNATIPLPSVEEQQQIVQEIESRLSVCDKVEETIDQSLQHAESLRQSILKQAFEGKLIKASETVAETA